MRISSITPPGLAAVASRPAPSCSRHQPSLSPDEYVASGRPLLEEAPARETPSSSSSALRPQSAAAAPGEVDGWNLAGAAPQAPARLIAGYPRSHLDGTTRAQDDFYQFAVGGYEAAHPIPPDKSRYGFRTEVYERVQQQLLEILEQAAKTSTAPGSLEQKLGDFYASGMDGLAIETAGVKPLAPLFERIDSIGDRQDLQDVVAEFHRDGLPTLFRLGAGPDLHDPSRVTADATQGGLGLPTREYYLEEKFAGKRQAYADYVSRAFQLLGDSPEQAEKAAQSVLRVETRLAEASLAPVEMRDAKALDHLMNRDELAALTPGFRWDRYFEKLGRGDLEQINVSTPGFFEKLDAHLAEAPLEDWKTYLRWSLINSTASYLNRDFEDASFDFYSKELRGVETKSPRWKTMVGLTDRYLGEALGQKFVEQSFPPEAKERALAMVGDIIDVLRDRIESLDWMSEESKVEALAKVDRLVVKIGYPDRWKDYSALEVTRGPLISNVLGARRFEAREQLDSIGKPVNRGQWEMTPSTVNAYFHPSLNEIVFPAARLQPPFFDPGADDASNYGATGVTIGHELTHGFDDSGADFDSLGRLRNWWQPADRERFEQIANGVTRQMDEFEFDGVRQNGKLVTGEALADQGGLELAYEALQRALARQPKVQSADGFTPEQRFFLSYAVAREDSSRPEAAKEQMQGDPHPLGKFRVNGPLANMEAFYDAFDVKPGDPMYRPAEERNKLWT
ncbi:MAG: M13 family metallopeptidase [Armatimonadetes bacterium]|nr:M13 family metallopeptidase [Armatimonadota bacterium]